MDQHEESVYKVAWSPADAWIYCSLSYDGRYLLVLSIILFSFTYYAYVGSNVYYCIYYFVV